MKKIALAFLLILVAGMAQATTIYDIQTGAVDLNSLVTPQDVVVTAVMYNGVFVAEAPYSEYNGIWVYTGSDDPHGLVPGDVVSICGEYKEYYDLSEIDIVAAGLYGSILKVGTQDIPAPSFVTAAELAADGEPWESCVVTIVDGMIVSEIHGYGEWSAIAEDGTPVRFDDFWFDDTTVLVDHCYNNATGVWYYGYGEFKLEAFEDGIELTECYVATEDVTFGTMKALYR